MVYFKAPQVLPFALEVPQSDEIEVEACFRRPAFDSGSSDPCARNWRETVAEPSAMQPDPPGDACPATATQDDLTRQFWGRFRGLNERIDAYLDQGTHRADPRDLEPLLRDVLERAHDCFLLAALIRGKAAQTSPAQHKCLADLDAFRRSLGGKPPPSGHEIAHALDSLIVQCVCLHVDHPPRAKMSSQRRLEADLRAAARRRMNDQ